MSSTNEITIVSGLPRSGTSLMMQMLVRGGIPPLVDGLREADPDNPRGYYEFERVKKTREDASWLPEARGKVVKVVSQLLYDLPASESYRIVLMRRDLAEVVVSQETMLLRRGQPIPQREAIASALAVHLDKLSGWLSRQEHMSVLEINYNTLIDAPEDHISRIIEFLDRPLDVEALVSAIDPRLYRVRDRTET